MPGMLVPVVPPAGLTAPACPALLVFFCPAACLTAPAVACTLVFWPRLPFPMAECSPSRRSPQPRQHQAVSALGQRSERGQGAWCMVLQGSSPGPARPRQVPTAMAVPTACTELSASFACLSLPHWHPRHPLCLHTRPCQSLLAPHSFPPCFPFLWVSVCLAPSLHPPCWPLLVSATTCSAPFCLVLPQYRFPILQYVPQCRACPLA